MTNAASAELDVIDGAGNVTRLSSHVGDVPVEISYNIFTGRHYFKNKWTGEEVKSWQKPTDTWEAMQGRMAAEVEAKRAAWDAKKAEIDAWEADIEGKEEPPPLTTAKPAAYVAAPCPQWITDSLKLNTAIVAPDPKEIP